MNAGGIGRCAIGKFSTARAVDAPYRDLGKLPPELADAIIAAADEAAAGLHDAHFPVDVYQTGSGTSINTNANEVIATLANRKLNDASTRVHPNDHFNMGQSSNDTFPTVMHITGATPIRLGQVFEGYLRQITNAGIRAQVVCDQLHDQIPIGGTAVGTSINTHP